MPKKIPQRTCMGCGEAKNKSELVRIVRTLEGGIILDVRGRADGRGAYVCRNAECMKKLRKRNGLARAFSIQVQSEIYDRLEKEFADEG
ncbi:MAG: YlxR family protein [Lachnospiraceae bacterium]|nr:YlxR family protein [Lachnospiraceae bacterium]